MIENRDAADADLAWAVGRSERKNEQEVHGERIMIGFRCAQEKENPARLCARLRMKRNAGRVGFG